MTKSRKDEARIQLRAKRLRTAREAKGISATEFAVLVGQKPGTYIHHENGTRAFDADDATRYAGKLAGTSAAHLLALGEEATETPEVAVMGEAALAVWVDSSLTTPLDVERTRNKNTLPIPNPKGAPVRFAIEVKDESVNRAMPEGHYAVCVPLEDGDRIEAGQLVYVEHVRGKLVQKSIRRVSERPKGGFQLKTYSTLAQYENTLEYPLDKRDESVSLRGRVIGHYGEIGLVKA